MPATTSRLNVTTRRHSEMIDITTEVAEAVDAAGIQEGTVSVYVPHTTAGVTINENADPDVVHDVLEALEAVVPWRQEFYEHSEGNSAAHVKSSLMGCTAVVPVTGGRMALGTWQAIFFCEFDGPRSRKTLVTVTGQ